MCVYFSNLGRRGPEGDRVLCKSTNIAPRKTHPVKW